MIDERKISNGCDGMGGASACTETMTGRSDSEIFNSSYDLTSMS